MNGPFVYRLGLQVFILARGVRLPYGLQQKIAMPPSGGIFYFGLSLKNSIFEDQVKFLCGKEIKRIFAWIRISLAGGRTA
jgi:hypothetical protein